MRTRVMESYELRIIFWMWRLPFRIVRRTPSYVKLKAIGIPCRLKVRVTLTIRKLLMMCLITRRCRINWIRRRMMLGLTRTRMMFRAIRSRLMKVLLCVTKVRRATVRVVILWLLVLPVVVIVRTVRFRCVVMVLLTIVCNGLGSY